MIDLTFPDLVFRAKQNTTSETLISDLISIGFIPQCDLDDLLNCIDDLELLLTIGDFDILAKIDEGMISFMLTNSNTLDDNLYIDYIVITDVDRILFYYNIVKLAVEYELSKK